LGGHIFNQVYSLSLHVFFLHPFQSSRPLFFDFLLLPFTFFVEPPQ
jgi:hypothetical protein